MQVKIGDYKGNPTITLGEGKFPFTFGLAKAKLVLEHVDAIRDFVAKYDKGKPAQSSPLVIGWREIEGGGK